MVASTFLDWNLPLRPHGNWIAPSSSLLPSVRSACSAESEEDSLWWSPSDSLHTSWAEWRVPWIASRWVRCFPCDVWWTQCLHRVTAPAGRLPSHGTASQKQDVGWFHWELRLPSQGRCAQWTQTMTLEGALKRHEKGDTKPRKTATIRKNEKRTKNLWLPFGFIWDRKLKNQPKRLRSFRNEISAAWKYTSEHRHSLENFLARVPTPHFILWQQQAIHLFWNGRICTTGNAITPPSMLPAHSPQCRLYMTPCRGSPQLRA